MKSLVFSLLFFSGSVYACDDGMFADYPECSSSRVVVVYRYPEYMLDSQMNHVQKPSTPSNMQGTPLNAIPQNPQPQQQQFFQKADDDRIRRLEEQVNRLESQITVLVNTVDKLTEYKNAQSNQQSKPTPLPVLPDEFKKKASTVPSLKNM